jgi:HEAT repeat protein
MLVAALQTQPVDLELVDQLVQQLGPRAAEPMLDVLANSESRTVRRALIDRLLRIPDATRAGLAKRATDPRWFVQRNMLYLAAELPGPPALDAAPFRQHEDPRVRREALRVQFRSSDRTRAICTALSDPDPRMKRLALNAVVEGGVPEPAVPLIIAVATDADQDSELRVAAIRALAAKGGRMALDTLLKLTEIRRRSLMDLVAQSTATPEYLAGVTALGALRSDPRARERLELIVKGRDPAAAKAAADALKGTA